MSDRPCNLEDWMRRRREWQRDRRGPEPRIQRAERQLGDGPTVDRIVDDRWIGSYAALPNPVDCRAFGGECDC